MSKNILNEISRMRDLFGYKKGQVISEQSYIHEDDAMVSPIKPGSIKTAMNMPEIKAELETNQYLADESWKSKTLPEINLHGLRKCNMSGYKEKGNMECNQIWDEHYGNFYEESVWKQKYGKDVPAEIKGTKDAKGNEMISNLDRTKTQVQTTGTTTGATVTTGTTASSELKTVQQVQNFQNWMDDKYGEWAYSTKLKRKYKVGKNPQMGWGKLGPNTQKAWTQYKNEYLKTQK
jgi:hypothetical protein